MSQLRLKEHTITIRVLAHADDGFPVESADIADIIRECTEGELVLAHRSESARLIVGDEAVAAVYAAGSTPDFFEAE